MTRWAQSLIKLSNYEVETLQKRLAEIADQRAQVEMRLAMLHAEGEAEQAAAAQDPSLGWRIVSYMEGLKVRMDAVPALGQHTDSILAGLGYSAEEIARLRQAGAL